MRKTYLYFLLIGLLVFSTGCPKNVPEEPAVMNKLVQYEANDLLNDANAYYCAKGEQPFEFEGENVQRRNFDCRNVEVNEPRARRYRDQIVHRLIRNIDSVYFPFENDLYKRRATGSFLADVTDIGLGLSTTITGGARAKTVLGAVTTAFRGGRKSGSINLYREQTAELLITKMQTSRNRELTLILTQIKDKNTDEYPLDAALGDTLRYFYAGTLHRAFQELRQDTAQRANEAEQGLLIVKNPTFSPMPAATTAAANKSTRSKLEELETDYFSDVPAKKTAAILKMREALTALMANAKAKAIIDAVLSGASAADIAALNDTKLLPTLEAIQKTAADDAEVSSAMSKALKVKL